MLPLMLPSTKVLPPDWKARICPVPAKAPAWNPAASVSALAICILQAVPGAIPAIRPRFSTAFPPPCSVTP
ncbi:hypothetical protein GCM10010964_01230 [Caldovatus sediminis]|uniref:Uncharacterized protein n=1 Tax=Caldovatus sediminis TaxID=2041189 RepID=A0A8J2Z7V8_9PROT|nr:hypothetical protein [Caldovatus sediminis]GGG16666.1 hypothetical protein GCM10010964_01230 [Caldovatus sediminis]